jgi:hypothetical protein
MVPLLITRSACSDVHPKRKRIKNRKYRFFKKTSFINSKAVKIMMEVHEPQSIHMTNSIGRPR